MKQFGPQLDNVEKSVEAMQLDNARDGLDRAQNEWDTKKEWNKGKFDPGHPDVVALDARFAEVAKAVSGLGAKADDAGENLPAVLNAVSGNSERLYETYDQARAAIRDFSSLRSDFDSGSEDDIGKLWARMDAVRVLVERVNAILPDSLAAARAFHTQFPDFNALDKLVKDGYQAGEKVKRIEAFPAEWLNEVSFVINEALDEAKSNIAQYGTDRLDRLQGSDEARWRNDHWVVGTYRYIGANCLGKLASGKYMVYRMMFRNTLQANGSWGPLEQWSVGHVYEILSENINK